MDKENSGDAIKSVGMQLSVVFEVDRFQAQIASAVEWSEGECLWRSRYGTPSANVYVWSSLVSVHVDAGWLAVLRVYVLAQASKCASVHCLPTQSDGATSKNPWKSILFINTPRFNYYAFMICLLAIIVARTFIARN